jgi:hypothetical protein
MSPSVRFSQEKPVPWCPQVRSSHLPDLSEVVVRSNQTARCDECMSGQTQIEYSCCFLALCEQALCFLAFFGVNAVAFFPVALRHRTQTLLSSQRTVENVPHCMVHCQHEQEKNQSSPKLRSTHLDGAPVNTIGHQSISSRRGSSSSLGKAGRDSSQPITPRKVGPFIPRLERRGLSGPSSVMCGLSVILAHISYPT